MATDYAKIAADNIVKYGTESARFNDFLARELYSDRTHFVYELVQNAEDALARRLDNGHDNGLPTGLRVHLLDDRLEVRHFGAPFDEEDVRGVCGILEGTKAGQPQQIGRFGIGFKSVYAVSASPEVHSGDEHFRIEQYVHPVAAEPRPTAGGETLIVIPLDRDCSGRSHAFDLIAERLRALGIYTLLFLRHIHEIEWQINDAEWGAYRKTTKAGSDWRIVTLADDSKRKHEEKWVVFERAVSLPGSSRTAKVEIAFQQTSDPKTGKSKITAVDVSPLFAYFPTEKDIELGFLVQGPYNTTPSRDNIRQDDPWNRALIAETAALVVAALHRFRQKRRLTVDVLRTMPLAREHFSGDKTIFLPIFEAVRDALRTEDLLPTWQGEYTAAETARIAHSERLRKLFLPAQLQSLYGAAQPLHWISAAITQERSPQLLSYLQDELGIPELRTDQVTYRVTDGFLREQTDDWMVSFYLFLGEVFASGRRAANLGSLPIIRLENGQHVAPLSKEGKPLVFLPTISDMGYPTVKRTIAADPQVLRFLQELGLRQPDECDEVMERVLPKYEGPYMEGIPDDEYDRDIRKIINALGTDSSAMRKRVLELARTKPILRARKNSSASSSPGRVSLRPPATVYYPGDDLLRFFSGNPEPWILELPSDLMSQKQTWADLGVSDTPRVLTYHPKLPSEEKLRLRGKAPATSDLELLDFDLDGVEAYLEGLQRSDKSQWEPRALLLWRYLRTRQDALHGIYRWHYYTEREASFDSKLARRLKTTAWLPGSDGVLHPPPDLDPQQLPQEFRRDHSLIAALRVGAKTEAQKAVRKIKEDHAAALGVALEDVEAIRRDPDGFRKWRQSSVTAATVVALPEREVANVERRRAKLLERVAEAPRKEFGRRIINVRVTRPTESPKEWLREHYTNADGKMACQICRHEMPFRMRNGQYYFEATQLLDDLEKEETVLYLALCPVCHAKYREFVKLVPAETQKLRKAVLAATTCQVPVHLGADGHMAIHFTEQHLYDVKVTMGALER